MPSVLILPSTNGFGRAAIGSESRLVSSKYLTRAIGIPAPADVTPEIDFLLGPSDGVECRVGPHLADKFPEAGLLLPLLAQVPILILRQEYGDELTTAGNVHNLASLYLIDEAGQLDFGLGDRSLKHLPESHGHISNIMALDCRPIVHKYRK